MGRPPKPSHLHALQGTFRQDRHGKETAPTPSAGELTVKDCPEFLTGRAREIWAENVKKLTWLTRFDIQTFAMWAALTSEFEADPVAMNTARLNQLRLIAGEIGLTASGRARLGVSSEQPEPDPAAKYLADPASEFLE